MRLKPYEVYATDTFKDVFETLDGSEKQWVAKIEGQLRQNEHPLGKILQFSWFREKKHRNKRLFYLVDERARKILFVAFASKKDQQGIIDFVIANKEELFSRLRGL